MRRLLVAVVGVWLTRWAALEIAAYAGRHWLRERVPRGDDRPPGQMPGPYDP